MTQDALGAEKGVFAKMVDAVCRFLPDRYERIPKESDLAKERQNSLDNIVRMHAEGSVLLGAARYTIDGDLLEDDDRPPTGTPN